MNMTIWLRRWLLAAVIVLSAAGATAALSADDAPLAFIDAQMTANAGKTGVLVLDTGTHRARRGERVIDLTAKEYDLLEMFMRHPRQVLTREVIYDRVWGYDFGGESNIIEVYVRYLRQKVETAGESKLLHTVRGVGYVLREDE